MKFGRFVLSLASVATLAFGSGSGFFVGGGVGFESAKVTRTQYYSLDFWGLRRAWDESGNINSESVGYVVGYRRFFTPRFALRFYLANDFKYSADYVKLGASPTNIKAIVSANADALYKFVVIDEVSLGAFAGLSFGYVSANLAESCSPSCSKSLFETAANFGVFVADKSSTFELFSKVALKDDSLQYGYSSSSFSPFEISVKERFNLHFRYTYTFN